MLVSGKYYKCAVSLLGGSYLYRSSMLFRNELVVFKISEDTSKGISVYFWSLLLEIEL